MKVKISISQTESDIQMTMDSYEMDGTKSTTSTLLTAHLVGYGSGIVKMMYNYAGGSNNSLDLTEHKGTGVLTISRGEVMIEYFTSPSRNSNGTIKLTRKDHSGI